MSVEFAIASKTGIGELYALILLRWPACCRVAANDFSVLFVSLELITITFMSHQLPAAGWPRSKPA